MLYVKSGLTGGTDSDLDSIQGTNLTEKDSAIILTDDTVYFYKLKLNSFAAEDSPNVIKPDDDDKGKRWLLVSKMGEVVYENVLMGSAIGYEPPDPPAGGGGYVIWQSNGSGLGDNGDIMIKITDTYGTTKVFTLVDFSEI